MQIVETSHLDSRTKSQLLELWNYEYPIDIAMNSMTDFNDYLAKLSDQYHLLLMNDEDNIRGWAFSFNRENERWFAIILSTGVQRNGFGTKMFEKLKSRDSELNGWIIEHSDLKKSNGSNYISPLSFYLKCGFELFRDVTLDHNQITMVKVKWRNNQLL